VRQAYRLLETGLPSGYDVGFAVNFHNRINVRLEPFLGCNKVLNVAILIHFGAQKDRFVAIAQLE